MRKRRVSGGFLLVICALSVLLLCTRAVSVYAATDKKVDICHFPPGKRDKPATLSVAKPAVKAHLAHGDSLGACGPYPRISSNGYLLGPLQSGFSLVTLLAVGGLVSLSARARWRDGSRR